jgi:phage baseplate assembly protein W
MPTFTNYIVNSGDTLASIASKILGSANRWTEFVAWNRLRYPYISDNPKDQLGILRGSFALESPLAIGSNFTNITTSLVSSGALSILSLRKGNRLFFTSYTNDGDIIHDTVSIRSYNSASGKIFFDFPTIAPPSVDPIVSGMAFIGTPPAVNSNSIFSMTAGNYYVAYSYVNAVGVETAVSPFSNYLDVSSNKQIRKTLFLSQEALDRGETIIFNGPSVFPDGVKSINVYLFRKSDTSLVDENTPVLYFQKSLTSVFPTYIDGYVSPSSYVAFRSYVTSVQYNSVKSELSTSGISFNYPTSSIVTIHDDPAESYTYVLKTGDILRIPTENSQAISSIGTFATDSPTDSLGADILIDIVGQISFDGQGGNDISVSSGYNNVRQSLRSRLSTPYGSLILQPEYGNKALNSLGSAYSLNLLEEIRLLCTECAYDDPRVLAVTSINVSYDKDSSAIFVSNFEIQTTVNESVINIEPLSITI